MSDLVRGLSLPRSVSLNSQKPARAVTPRTNELRNEHAEASRRAREAGEDAAVPFCAGEVLPRLWLGSMEAAWDADALRERGITRILNATREDEVENCFPEEFEYMRVALFDVPRNAGKMERHLDAACAFVGGALDGGSGVLVHCAYGRSRSATLVLAYMVRERGMSLAEALAVAREARPSVSPNVGFAQLLLEVEHAARGERTLDIAEYAAHELLEFCNPDGEQPELDLELMRRAVAATEIDELGLVNAMRWVEQWSEENLPKSPLAVGPGAASKAAMDAAVDAAVDALAGRAEAAVLV